MNEFFTVTSLALYMRVCIDVDLQFHTCCSQSLRQCGGGSALTLRNRGSRSGHCSRGALATACASCSPQVRGHERFPGLGTRRCGTLSHVGHLKRRRHGVVRG